MSGKREHTRSMRWIDIRKERPTEYLPNDDSHLNWVLVAYFDNEGADMNFAYWDRKFRCFVTSDGGRLLLVSEGFRVRYWCKPPRLPKEMRTPKPREIANA